MDKAQAQVIEAERADSRPSTVCIFCNKVSVEDKAWEPRADHPTKSPGARFSPGFCPGCYEARVKQAFASL